jgi:hypothetical protein
MNEFTQLNQELARDLVRQRQPRRAPTPSVARHRRTSRRALASGLHRLADRLDAGL